MTPDPSNAQLAGEREASLLDRIRRRDSTGLSETYRRHADAVYAGALNILRDDVRARRVAGAVFVHLWQRPSAVVALGEGLRSALLGYCHRLVVEDLRQHRFDDDGRLVETAEQQILQAVPEDARGIVSLAYFGGHTYIEIATIVDCSVEGVLDHLDRGLRALVDQRHREEEA